MAVGHIKLESPENTEEMGKEKLQRVNEPGVVVKCLFIYASIRVLISG
jgi:hypothetical protein